MNLFIFVLVCYGACNCLIYGSIFEGFRDYLTKFGTSGYSLHKLFTCFMCLSTWMGFIISAILIVTKNETPITINNPYLSIFFHGLLSSACVWLIHTLQEHFEK